MVHLRPDPHASAPMARAIAVLEAVAEADMPLAVAEIAARTGIPKPTAHRLVNHLLAEGLLRPDPLRRGLAPGPRLFNMFCKVQAGTWATGAVRALLEELVGEVRETCNLGVLDRNAVLYVERIECDWPIRVQLGPGSRVPLHATAIGKLLLAHMPANARRRLLRVLPLPALTPATLTDAARLEATCDAIACQGYAENNAENMDGIVGLAVPVRDAAGRVIAGLSVHAPGARTSVADACARLALFQRTAQRLAAALTETTTGDT
ncbi:MAG: IclR family transcriptional regulator [Rhodospirillaceae bacterium]